jgi:hypothetical protein
MASPFASVQTTATRLNAPSKFIEKYHGAWRSSPARHLRGGGESEVMAFARPFARLAHH